MAANSDHLSIPGRRLAERLRDLREQAHLTQKQLARVLGGTDALSIASISLWEKTSSGRLPPTGRLAAYARLFCTSRSFDSGVPRLLRDDELTQEERERRAELYDELLALRERALPTEAGAAELGQLLSPGVPRSIWHFPDGRQISVVCSDAPDEDRPPYARPGHLNYSRFAKHSDIDTLIDVVGQLKADNPASMVRILSPHELVGDFALNHLVIIGGAAVYDAAPYFAQDIPLPEARLIEGTDTHFFKCKVGEEEREFRSVRGASEALIEDVGLIARGPHPNIPQRTVTVLSGITSRGVHGAALCFTDSHIRADNEQYLREAFGDNSAFCILMRIPVQYEAALPPSLWRDHVRLYEWSAETGARW